MQQTRSYFGSSNRANRDNSRQVEPVDRRQLVKMNAAPSPQELCASYVALLSCARAAQLPADAVSEIFCLLGHPKRDSRWVTPEGVDISNEVDNARADAGFICGMHSSGGTWGANPGWAAGWIVDPDCLQELRDGGFLQ